MQLIILILDLKSNWDVIFKYVIKDLTSLGWQIIRQNEHTVSFLKNGYYVDIFISITVSLRL